MLPELLLQETPPEVPLQPANPNAGPEDWLDVLEHRMNFDHLVGRVALEGMPDLQQEYLEKEYLKNVSEEDLQLIRYANDVERTTPKASDQDAIYRAGIDEGSLQAAREVQEAAGKEFDLFVAAWRQRLLDEEFLKGKAENTEHKTSKATAEVPVSPGESNKKKKAPSQTSAKSPKSGRLNLLSSLFRPYKPQKDSHSKAANN